MAHESWKSLPGSKLADGNGLKWVMPNNGPHFRIMDANPNGLPSQQIPYSKFWKNGTFIDINGNSLSSGDLPEAHIPISELTDDFLDFFFN